MVFLDSAEALVFERSGASNRQDIRISDRNSGLDNRFATIGVATELRLFLLEATSTDSGNPDRRGVVGRLGRI